MASKTDQLKGWLNPSIERRKFIKAGAALAAGAAVGSSLFKQNEALAATYGQNDPNATEYDSGVYVIRSVCQMCHSRCGIQARVKDGVLLKIDGNPYHPNNLEPDERLDYTTATSTADVTPGRLCLKGQSGIQTVYDPYRIKQPLRRKPGTERGAGEWEAISWDTAFSEIAATIDALIPAATRYDYMDPSNTKKGKNANMLGFCPGRSTEKTLSSRIWKSGWGTVNYDLTHTSICEATRHVGNEVITWQYKSSGGKNRYGSGRTEGWQPDTREAEFIILFGTNPFEAGFPMNPYGRKLVEAKRNSGAKYVVVDPRMSNSAAQADKWYPIKPGQDAALALGMARWIIENSAHDTTYLGNATKGAANADNEWTWSDATYLVKYGSSPATYLNASEAGLGGGAHENVVLVSGTATTVPGSTATTDEFAGNSSTVVEGDLEVDTTVNGIAVKSAFTLFKAQAMSKTLAEWAGICGLTEADVIELATEFTSHGKKAVAITYRGAVKHTNGLFNQVCIQHLNSLIGNYDWRGGCTKGGASYGEKTGVVAVETVTNSPYSSSIGIDRKGKFYDAVDVADLFTGTYPATRMWGPFWLHGNYQEVIPSVEDQYPYGMKVLITYWNAWPYSTPGLQATFERTILSGGADNYDKLPLLVSISPVMGEVPAMADYVLPDSTYLEKFSTPGIPWMVQGGTSFQRPVVGKFDGKDIGGAEIGATIPTGSANDYTPVLPNTKAVVDIHIGLAKALGYDGSKSFTVDGASKLIKAVGNSAYTNGDNLNNVWDYAYAMLRNIRNSALSDYPTLTVDEIIAKGGVFKALDTEYGAGPLGSGTAHLTSKYANSIRFYLDSIVRVPDSVTGTYYSGVPHYEDLMHSDGTSVHDDKGSYPYLLNTYKLVNHGQARTAVNPWLMLVMPENAVWINASDAAALGVETGDTIRLTSASNSAGVTGKVWVTNRIRPGVVGVSHHYGHWQLGSKPHIVDGVADALGHDTTRGAGIQTNPISRLDKVYTNVPLQEKIGGSVCYFNTYVKITKVS